MEVFVGVFDNDDDDKLGLLKEEETTLADSIFNLGWKSQIRGNMGGKSLVDLLGKIREEITVFHFSGHHGHGVMQVVDGKVNTAPFIDFLNDCPNLKLVFINGCNSQDFVDRLKNVPIVIGTHKKIIDSYAKEVSTRFYKTIENEPEKFNDSVGISEIFKVSRQLDQMSITQEEMMANTRGGDDDDDDEGQIKDVYLIQINKDAPNFDKKVSPKKILAEKDVNKNFFELTKKIEEELGHSDIGEGELYKAYPYLFSQHLYDLKPELEKAAGFVNPKKLESLTNEYSKLSLTRSGKIIALHCQLITFLKYCGCSMLWTLHRRKQLDMHSLSAEEKKLIQNNLFYNYYGSAIGPDKIIDLGKIYQIIPENLIQNEPVWVKMKKLVSDEAEYLKNTAIFFQSFKDSDVRSSEKSWLEAETFLTDFITKESFSFLKDLSIWSVYDIYFRQFRFRDDKELVFTKGHFPIATRPVEGRSELTKVMIDPDTKIDYDVQSVYLAKGDDRILNLTPFYLDMNATDENANKMQICYLEKYPKSLADVKLKYISLKDEKDTFDIGEEDDDDDQKKIYQQMQFFWSLISDA